MKLKKQLQTKTKTITANKILKKYKNMKKTKKTYLVNEEDLETIDYSNQEDLFQKESIVNATNKVLDFNEFEKQQEEAIKFYKLFSKKSIYKNKRSTLDEEEQLIEIIKVPKKRKQKVDKASQIAAKKYQKSTKTLDLDN